MIEMFEITAYRRLSEDFGAEEESAVPVEQIFQDMRQREMEM